MTARTGVIAGSSGAIPDDMLLDKYRVTDIEFDENEYNNFARRTLADFRPDAPFLESDQPRDPSDRGSGNLSAMKISLRENGFVRKQHHGWMKANFWIIMLLNVIRGVHQICLILMNINVVRQP